MKPTDLKCYTQVSAVIGEALADYELGRVIDSKWITEDKPAILDSFPFYKTPQKEEFWLLIEDGKNPYDHGHEKPEVKEWAYIDYTVAGDSNIAQWCQVLSDCYIGANLNVFRDSKDVNVLAKHKSVTMPDWVPANLDKQDYKPEDVDFKCSSIKQAKELFNKLYDKDITEDQAKALLVLIEHFSTTTQTPPPIG